MLMRDVPINSVVFAITKFDGYDEIRETFYAKISENEVLHYGCIQGNPSENKPRYVNLDMTKGHKYPLVGALPVYPGDDSAWLKCGEKTVEASGKAEIIGEFNCQGINHQVIKQNGDDGLYTIIANGKIVQDDLSPDEFVRWAANALEQG